MGLDLELFVHPERISPQLICPICTQVLQNPVQTSSEHLFCEDELLEWMTRSSLCPVTKSELDPASIRKPGRIIMNMLAELELYCTNKANGCKWVGQNEHLASHLKTCSHRSSDELRIEIQIKNDEILQLSDRLESLESRNEELLEENEGLRAQLVESERKLRIYDAFLNSNSSELSPKSRHELQHEHRLSHSTDQNYSMSIPQHSSNNQVNASGSKSDVDRLSRLRTLNSLTLQNNDKCSKSELSGSEAVDKSRKGDSRNVNVNSSVDHFPRQHAKASHK